MHISLSWSKEGGLFAVPSSFRPESNDNRYLRLTKTACTKCAYVRKLDVLSTRTALSEIAELPVIWLRGKTRASLGVYSTLCTLAKYLGHNSLLHPSCKSAVQTVQEMSKQLYLTLRHKMAEMKSDLLRTHTLQASLLIQVSVPL